MAETLIFHYQAGDSYLHRLNVPVKLIALLFLSLMLLPVSFFRILLLLPFIALGHMKSGIRIGSFIREGTFFLIMGIIIFFSNALSLNAILPGILKTIRFFMILWMALIFTYTTDPLSISSGVYQILNPIPLLPARHISTTLGLSLTMLPLIIDQIREIREAMWSRCGMTRRRPLRTLIRLGIPLMEGILVKAENLSDAMESRLFTEDATPPENRHTRGGGVILLILLLFWVGILWIERSNFSHSRIISLFIAY